MLPLADISQTWGGDLDTTASGDIAIVTGRVRTIQHVIRRLMTVATTLNSSAYPWNPQYGAGLGARIGQVLDTRSLQAIVLSQMMREASVARNPRPSVTVTEITNGATINIQYVDNTGTNQSFSFNMAP